MTEEKSPSGDIDDLLKCPQINVKELLCLEGDEIQGITYRDVLRRELEDDGSVTVVIRKVKPSSPSGDVAAKLGEIRKRLLDLSERLQPGALHLTLTAQAGTWLKLASVPLEAEKIIATLEQERRDLELALKAAREAQHPCNDINAPPCAWMQNANNVKTTLEQGWKVHERHFLEHIEVLERSIMDIRDQRNALEQERTARDAECTAALRLAEGRIAMLMKADLPDSDHPIATEYVLRELRRALGD